jgi:hypothetical protein
MRQPPQRNAVAKSPWCWMCLHISPDHRFIRQRIFPGGPRKYSADLEPFLLEPFLLDVPLPEKWWPEEP